MRILNRPMFRYGGPIKEGVMHGMRDGGRTLAGGNQMGTPMGNRTGFAKPWDWKQKLLMKIPGFSNIYKKGIANWGKVIDKTKGIPKNLQGVFTRTGTTPGITSTGAGQTFLKNLKSFSFPGSAKAWNWAKKAATFPLRKPKTTALTALYGGKPLYDLATGPGKKLVETVADVAVPDWIYNWDTGRWFNPDDKDLKSSDKKILEEKKTEAIGSGAQFKEDTAPLITDAMRDKIAKDAQNTRLKSYLDMMGYDSAKKGALSKALIDASAVVQQGTEEAGSLKEADWGKLINRMIQTTSKRLEKPEQIREAVGLMMTKGAIEKDLTKETDALKTKALELQIEKAEKDLKGLSIGELIPNISKGLGKTRVDAEVMKNVMSVKEPDIIATIVGKKEDLQDIKDTSDFTTIEDYIVKKYEGKEGIYIIDNVVVQIDANGVPDRLY